MQSVVIVRGGRGWRRGKGQHICEPLGAWRQHEKCGHWYHPDIMVLFLLQVDIPSMEDPVGKLEHMGKETVKKLQDLKGAAAQVCLFRLAVLCDSLRCGAYGTDCLKCGAYGTTCYGMS